MCGRLNVIDDPLSRIVCEQLGIRFSTKTNHDLKPTQTASTVIASNDELQQLDLPWGTKPSWSKKILINAQAETANIKPTFSDAFSSARVVVPCSGWYEWAVINGKKQKLLFQSNHTPVLYMAGLALNNRSEVVTLTTTPTLEFAQYHHRMPLLLEEDDVKTWLLGHKSQAKALAMKKTQVQPSVL
ncbi:SOS response-associated peptidase family protein [Vibrio vulnificus]